MKTIKELNEAKQPYLDKFVEINKKYSFSHSGRSEEDIKTSKELWDKMRSIDDEFDKANPIAPCPKCGYERKASGGGILEIVLKYPLQLADNIYVKT